MAKKKAKISDKNSDRISASESRSKTVHVSSKISLPNQTPSKPSYKAISMEREDGSFNEVRVSARSMPRSSKEEFSFDGEDKEESNSINAEKNRVKRMIKKQLKVPQSNDNSNMALSAGSSKKSKSKIVKDNYGGELLVNYNKKAL